MPLWKITDNVPSKVSQTMLKKEKLLEEHLEGWIECDPSILGEPLLVFGRQVIIPDIRDRLDLLAIDPQGTIVVIELKRGHLKDPVDVQSLRYASYISKWRFQDFENIARSHFGKVGDPEFNFNEVFESFCTESGVDDVPDINTDQRIIIVGAAVREKLGSVALWLRDHNVDIKLIEIHAYKEGTNIFIEPSTIVPLPVSKFVTVGKPGKKNQPWAEDGKSWHLEKKCSPKTKKMLIELDNFLQDELDLDEPRWNQKLYVAYPVNNFHWLRLHTKSSMLVLDIVVKKGIFDTDSLASNLGVEKFDSDESLSGKLNLPSSVSVTNRNQVSDRIRLRLKDDFDLDSKAFTDLLQEAYKANPRQP